MTAEARDGAPSAAALLRDWVASGTCLGGQLFVWAGDRVVADTAVGRSGIDRAAAATDQARLYCAIKPLTACCLALAVDEGRASFDDPVSRYLPEFSGHGRASITIRQLLSHTSGIFDYGLDPYATGFAKVVRLACTYPLAERSWYGGPRYNHVIAWHVLVAVAERIYEADFPAIVERMRVTIPGSPEFRVTRPDPARYVRSHILRQGGFVAIPDPPQSRYFATVNPAHGGFGSARDLGLLYAELVRSACGVGALLSSPLAMEITSRQSVIDFGLGRDTRGYGLGFMTDVRSDGLGGGWSAQSFGHAGYIGPYRVIHAFADTAHRIVVAIRLFSVTAKNNWRMHRLGAAIWSDLGIG